MKTLKYISYIVLVLIIIGIIFIVVTNRKAEAPIKEITPQTETTPTPQSTKGQILDTASTPREICYAYNTAAGDNATLRMMFTGTGGSQVIGIFKYQAAGKSPLIGPLSGTAGPLNKQAMARTADLIWQTSKTTKEKLSIVFGDGSASPKSAVTPSSLLLSQADCGTPVIK